MEEIASFESFTVELQLLVEKFSKNTAEFKGPSYNEAKLRDDFLNPLFEALGWDLRNKAGLIQSKREVEIESPTRIGSGKKRADYLFRVEGRDRFVCEAKKPSSTLDKGPIFQAKRYAWNKDLPLAVLTDFEEIKFYIVGARPDSEEPSQGEYKVLHYSQYVENAHLLWDLLGRDQVQGGSIDQLIEALPKKASGKGKMRQGYLIKPDRNRALDVDFLNFLDEARKELASSLVKHNDRDDLFEDNRLNEATQKILDRILFLRICEDRDIDTGSKLQTMADIWKAQTNRQRPERKSLLKEEGPSFGARAPEASLYRRIVQHFRELDRRPPSTVPFFNGQLFKQHFSEDLEVGDDFLFNLIQDLADENSPYLFNVIPVEILGSVYERFLGKVVQPKGRGVTVEEKPEVRKAGGVYYTPRYIVDYIVEQTVGRLLDDIAREKEEDGVKAFSTKTEKLSILDPACGSGSFLIRAYERVCEHWQKRLTDDLPTQKDKEARNAWEKKHRPLCWVDTETGDVHLTVNLKRTILTKNIFGVDLDAAAVEVTQLSLYLKMLENENRNTLKRERDFFADVVALLPTLVDNIKCGNSLIASDFSLDSDDLVRVRAFDWPVQFKQIMQNGGFDAVIGNPPYIRIQTLQETDPTSVAYLNNHYASAAKGNYDIYVVFVERALSLLNLTGKLGYILPHKFFNAQYGQALRGHITRGKNIERIIHFGDQQVFEGATTYTCLFFLQKASLEKFSITKVKDIALWQVDGSGVEGHIKSTDLGSEEWNFHIGPDAELFSKLSGHSTTLGDVALRMAQGIRTSANEVYVLDVTRDGTKILHAQSKILEREVKVDRKSTYRFLQGRDIKRYALHDSRKIVIIPYDQKMDGLELIDEKELKESQPNTFDYFCENKAYLEAREKGRMRGKGWYGFIYPKNIDIMQSPKILVPDIADGASYALDEAGEFAFTSGYAITLKPEIKISPKFILGLLNSKLLDFFLKKVSTTMRGGFFRYFTQFIEKIPIVIPDFDCPTERINYDKLVGLVDKMLILVPKLRAATSDREKETLQNVVSATDQQIDQLVYELYGLTDDEIRLVEGSSRKS